MAKYPDGKDFAFTITDDPDYSELQDSFLLYNFLDSLGFRTTIAVWVLDNKHGSGIKGGKNNTGGMTTTDSSYLKFLRELQEKGFEICLHTVSPGNDFREETIKGYELFKDQFGHYPKININHANNLENIYWGKNRFSDSFLQFFYSLIKSNVSFQGDNKSSRYFWGDICKEKTTYVRGWATDDINTLSTNKSTPYHLEDKSYVNYWFGCSDGRNCNKFNKITSDANIKNLVAERGTCIFCTHFAYGFVDRSSKTVNECFKKQLTKISKLNGWFVPASTILDRFILLKNVEIIKTNDTVLIVNHNNTPVTGLTILTNQEKLYLFNDNEWKHSNNDGEIILGDLQPYTVVKLGKAPKLSKQCSLGMLERANILWNWFSGRFNK